MATKIAVSACLLGVACRYDGRSKPSADVIEYLRSHNCEVTPICPEVMGGLSIPHPAHEIKRGEDGTSCVVDELGTDHTEEFIAGAHKACSVACDAACTHAILKAKSPSCGVGEIYDGTFSRTLTAGDGVAARMLREAGIMIATENDFLQRFADLEC